MPTARSANVEIYYEVHGPVDAPAIVFAHGAGGNAASWWQQVPAFMNDHRVVTFDHRGFGRSKCAAADFHVKHFEADALAVMDAAAVQRAVFVCQSMGGWTGVRMAARYAQRVRALVLCNTPGAVHTPELIAGMAETGRMVRGDGLIGAAISHPFAAGDPAGAFLYGQIAAFSSPRPDLSSLSTRDGFISDAEVERLRSLPVHMIGSDLDPLFPPPVLRSIAARIGASIEFVSGAGHSTYFEKPQDFNARVRAFLGGLPA